MIFQGGETPCPPPPLWIRPCHFVGMPYGPAHKIIVLIAYVQNPSLSPYAVRLSRDTDKKFSLSLQLCPCLYAKGSLYAKGAIILSVTLYVLFEKLSFHSGYINHKYRIYRVWVLLNLLDKLRLSDKMRRLLFIR